jgi:hypothetical protein
LFFFIIFEIRQAQIAVPAAVADVISILPQRLKNMETYKKTCFIVNSEVEKEISV